MQPEPDVEPLTKVCTDALGGAEPWITRLVAFVIPSEDESPVSVAGVSERLVGAAVLCGTVVVVVGAIVVVVGAMVVVVGGIVVDGGVVVDGGYVIGGTVVVVVVVDGVSTATGATIGFGGEYEQPDNCTG